MITIKFTEQEVKIMRELLLLHPEGAELFERLGNELRKEKGNGNRSTKKSKREVPEGENKQSHH